VGEDLNAGDVGGKIVQIKAPCATNRSTRMMQSLASKNLFARTGIM
jgi:hypothetical protein